MKLSRIYFWYHGGFRLWEVARSLRLSDGCILLNQQDREIAIQDLGVPAEKIRISANGIPDSFTDLPTENESENKSRIAVIGTYSERKGITYSVPALQRLLDLHPELEIGFFGTGCAPPKVFDDFSPAVRARVHVVPSYSHEELPELLRGFQIQLLASVSEGFAKALLEGMACGLAAVTTDVSGAFEIARDGENALVVPRRNSEAIFAALNRLIVDPTLRETLRRAAHATAQKFTWRAMAAGRLAFYEEVRQKREARRTKRSKS